MNLTNGLTDTVEESMPAVEKHIVAEQTWDSRKPKWSQTPILVAGGVGVGSGLEQLHHPNDISLDVNGTVYVADYSNKRVVRWRMDSSETGEIVAGGDLYASTPLALRYPRRIHVTKDDTLYILDDDQVLKLPKNASHFTLVSSMFLSLIRSFSLH